MQEFCVIKAKKSLLSILLFLFTALAAAKDNGQVIMWPGSGTPTLKITFGKMHETSSYGGERYFTQDATVENVSPKNIPFASFTVYLLDKDKVRIADNILQIKDIGPNQQVKQSLQFHASGTPASVDLVARNDASGVPNSLRTIPLKILSVPTGAKLKIDGQEVGTTPYSATLRSGSHSLEFSKEGYSTGTTPLDVAPDELPGGSITFELGGLSKDTVELRDGTVLLCDVLSMSLTQVSVRVAGQDQTYDRNQIKKMILVERVVTQQPVVTQPQTKQ